MTESVAVRPFRGADEATLLALWNETLTHDRSDAALLRTQVLLDASAVWDDFLAVLRSHALMRGGVSSFRYPDYYDALSTMRGCLGGFAKAVALVLPPGGWVRRLSFLPGMEPSAA